jgi:hypothetical protein
MPRRVTIALPRLTFRGMIAVSNEVEYYLSLGFG